MLDRILRYSDLKAAGHGSRTTIWRNVKIGRFPAPDLVLPNGAPGWYESTLGAYRARLEATHRGELAGAQARR